PRPPAHVPRPMGSAARRQSVRVSLPSTRDRAGLRGCRTDIRIVCMSNVIGFDFSPRTRVVFGLHTVDRLGELARELGARRVLLVTDAGIVVAGHVERALHAHEGAGLEVVVYD